VPLGERPGGQVVTHVADAGTRSWSGGQVTHVPALPVHVAQLLAQAWQTLLLLANVPAGHVPTQVVPFR
jgi:hypothetical protein